VRRHHRVAAVRIVVPGTDAFPRFRVGFLLAARLTAWLGFGSLWVQKGYSSPAKGSTRKASSVFLNSVRAVHTLQPSAGNLLRSCRREVCPQEGKDDPVIKKIWSGGLGSLPTSIFHWSGSPLALLRQCGYKLNCAL